MHNASKINVHVNVFRASLIIFKRRQKNSQKGRSIPRNLKKNMTTVQDNTKLKKNL